MSATSGTEALTARFCIGADGGDHVQVDVVARQHPHATDYWGGNWVTAQVSLVARPWSGTFRADLRSDEFSILRDGLQRLYEDPAAPDALFEAMEPWLRFKVRRTDSLGHIEVRGEARQEPFFDGHNILEFVLEMDQSYLPRALDGLNEVLEAFPVIGSPT